MQFSGDGNGIIDLICLYIELGLSDEVARHRIVIEDGDTWYMDDGLSEEELNVIVGVNHVYTGTI